MSSTSTVDPATTSSTPADLIPLSPIPRLLLSPVEAAAALRISPRLLWSKTKAREIPAIKIGRLTRYSPSALQGFIDRACGE